MYNTVQKLERPNWTELRVDTLYLLLTEDMAIRAMQQLMNRIMMSYCYIKTKTIDTFV